MEVPMKEPAGKSTAVHSFGWEPIKSGMRGNVHVQFKNKDGELTQRGYYEQVQKAIYAGLETSMKPGLFIHHNLKEHFKWVPVGGPQPSDDPMVQKLAELFAAGIDVVIPVDTPNTVEAIEKCYDEQCTRMKNDQPKEGLFT